MPRVNVYLPAELQQVLRDKLPDVNLSQLLQEAIRGVLGCEHHELVCGTCAQPVDRWALVDERLGRFYGDLMWALEALVRRCGTAEGAARVLRDVGQRWQIGKADTIPLPRPSRSEREAARLEAAEAAGVAQLSIEAASRRRHPTARAARPANPQAIGPAQEVTA